MSEQKIISFESLASVRDKHPNKRIVHCHGVFDLLHAGHLIHFQSAKKFGDILVVTITPDEFVNKGPGRPRFNSMIRANMIAALEIVDFVAINKFPLAVPAIEQLQPHSYVKGPDYKDKASDVTGGIFAEEQAVEKHGGKLVFTQDDTYSSSNLINEYFSHWTEAQQIAIEKLRGAGGYSRVQEILEKVAEETVLVVGEPIVDTYVFCVPENISSKSPSISAKFLYEENYAGGVLAIANHLADFTKSVRLLTTHGGEPYFRELLTEKLDPRIQMVAQEIPSVPTPRKTRFITNDRSQRVFELTNLRSDQWTMAPSDEFCKTLENLNRETPVTILADFGHGLFEADVLSSCKKLTGFVGLNVQTNSSNFGFNPFTKHKKFSYLSIDTKEARLACHDRFTSPIDLATRLHGDIRKIGAAFAMTLGSNGSCFFPAEESKQYFSPAFADNIVDATGAGDAYFAMTTMLMRVGCPHDFIPFLGNIFAGLKTKIVGNKEAVSRAQFLKNVSHILK